MASARILVVEDEKIVARDIRNTLEGLGYAVPNVAASGEEAVEKAAKTQPDLVLMDIVLQGELDGVKAAGEIRARFDIPVVYLTAYSDEETLQRAKITEPYGYIVKPFSDRELHTNIEIALYKHMMDRKLKASERWLAATLKSMGDAVIAINAEGWVTFVNLSAEALTGRKQGEALGNGLPDVLNKIDEETRTLVERLVKKAMQEGTVSRLSNQIMLRAKDGKQVPIEISAAPIRDDKRAVVGVVLAFRDISERKQAEQALGEAEKEFARMKNELIMGISHGLRNPLHTLKGYLELLSKGKLDDPRLKGEFQVRALQDVDRISRTVDNLIEMTQPMTGEFKLRIEQVDLSVLIGESFRSLEGAAQLKGVALTHALPRKLPKAVGDRRRLRQVFANLIDNAIKFSEKGGVVLVTGAVMPNGNISIRVIDQGAGIHKEVLPRVFDKFYGLESTVMSSDAGPGLGLYTAKKIIEAHGCRIEVESEPRKGSTFYFSLPVQTV